MGAGIVGFPIRAGRPFAAWVARRDRQRQDRLVLDQIEQIEMAASQQRLIAFDRDRQRAELRFVLYEKKADRCRVESPVQLGSAQIAGQLQLPVKLQAGRAAPRRVRPPVDLN